MKNAVAIRFVIEEEVVSTITKPISFASETNKIEKAQNGDRSFEFATNSINLNFVLNNVIFFKLYS